MSDKLYRWLIAGTSSILAVILSLFLWKTSSDQKNEPKEQSCVTRVRDTDHPLAAIISSVTSESCDTNHTQP
jgi:hypothetical protein